MFFILCVRTDVRRRRPCRQRRRNKKTFDRGGPDWPPRSNVANDRLGGGLGRLCPPSQNSGGLGGSAPQPKIFRKFLKKFEEYIFFIFEKVSGLGSVLNLGNGSEGYTEAMKVCNGRNKWQDIQSFFKVLNSLSIGFFVLTNFEKNIIFFEKI